MKILLDLVPFIAFLGTWSQFGIYHATAVLIITLWIAVVLDYFFVGKKRNNMMLGTAVIATVFGVLTLVLRNALFIHIKPTVIFGLQGLVFLGSHFIGDKVILQRLMGAQIPMPDAQWRRSSLPMCRTQPPKMRLSARASPCSTSSWGRKTHSQEPPVKRLDLRTWPT